MTFVSRGIFSLKSMPRPQFAADMFALIVILTGVCINEMIAFFNNLVKKVFFCPKCEMLIFWPDIKISSDFYF